MPFRFFAFFIFTLCLKPSVSAQQLDPLQRFLPPEIEVGQTLTRQQALALAQRQNPLFLGNEAQVAGAKANLQGQRVPINPTFNYSGLNNSVSPLNPGASSNYAVLATVETNGSIAWRTSQAKNLLFATQSDQETALLTLRQSVLSAYIDLQTADLALENEKTAYANASRLSDLTEKQFQIGAAPETNAIRTRIALTQEESLLLKAASEVRLARANLNLQMGRSPNEPLGAADPLRFTPIEITLDTLLLQAEKMRPELRSSDYNRRALRAAVGLQNSQYYPNVLVGTDLRSVQASRFQVGFSLPLFDFGGIRGAVRKAKQDVKVQEFLIRQLRQQIQLDVQNAYLTMLRAQRTVRLFQDGILPRSESLLKRIEAGYSLGASTLLDLIDAQNTARSTRNDYNNALSDHEKALAQLERAIGKPLSLKETSAG